VITEGDALSDYIGAPTTRTKARVIKGAGQVITPPLMRRAIKIDLVAVATPAIRLAAG